jgi:hypothetical protein
MSVVVITYDLKHEIRRPPIVKFIKENFAWARLSESSYAVETDLTPMQIRDVFMPFLDSDDQLYVVQLTQWWAGFGPPEVNDWLSAKLNGQLSLAA